MGVDSSRPGLALGSVTPTYVHGNHAAPGEGLLPAGGGFTLREAFKSTDRTPWHQDGLTTKPLKTSLDTDPAKCL